MSAKKYTPTRELHLTNKLDKLKEKISQWAIDNGFWDDVIFKIPFFHLNDAPKLHQVLFMCFDGDIHSVFNGAHEEWENLEEEFRKIVSDSGFEYELIDHVTLNLFSSDPAEAREYLKMHRWQWIQNLAENRLFELHSEVYEHFAEDPDQLKGLHWRHFEEFLDSIFRNQGFRTELGPGSNDGGVDIRIYQSESIPEIVTVVQAKKYAEQPIGFEAVAALTMAALRDRASRALFATTSRYQPAARKFALTTQSRLDIPTLELAGPQHFKEWCKEISEQLRRYFLAGGQAPPEICRRPSTELTGKIVVARWGYNAVYNNFALIEADYPHEVILRSIGSRIFSGGALCGTELPDLAKPPSPLDPPRILAFKTNNEWSQVPSFWGDQKLFSIWDGSPQFFDLCD